MTIAQYLLGFVVTSFWLALVVGVLAVGLWVQGWLAGRHYYNRGRADPWGTLSGHCDIRLLRAARGEDKLVAILPSSDLMFEMPNGEIIGPPTPGRISDGESAPPIVWPITGGPLNGRSRDAALGIHDELCAHPDRPPASAHGVFYCVMRSRGMWWRGPIKYAVLLNWGTKW